MRRSVSFIWLAAAAIASSTGSSAVAADKRPALAEAEARDDVSQALLAETLGDNAGRTKRLTKAWMSVPDLAEANWHMARVRSDGKWQPLAEAVSIASQDPDQENYRRLRERATGNAKAVRDLARWCEKQGWHDRARLHYAQLLADPKAEASIKSEAVEKLDLVQAGGAWLTREEVKARQEGAKAIQDSLAKWRPKLKALQQVIDGADFAKRDKAIAEFEKLDDPEMIPALETFLLDGRADFQEQAVKKLAGFKHHEATEALVRYAVLAESSLTRDAATSALKDRPQHEYVPLLLGGLVSPLKSQFQVTWDRRGRVNYVHSVLAQSPSGNLLLTAHQLAVPVSIPQNTHKNDVKIVPVTETAKKNVSRLITGPLPGEAAREQRAGAALDAANAETQVRLANSQSQQHNKRILEVLNATTNRGYHDPVEWWTWWQQYNGYTWPRPTKYLYRYNPYAYNAARSSHTSTSGTAHPPRPGSCFLAGTPIRTEMGAVPIESVRPGDRVLAQEQDSGELTYKVVLTTTLRPPTKMVRIKAGNEEIVTTLGHPFWVSGHGWKMAKELKEGELLHSLGGAVKIESVAPAGEEQAHNLVVDDFNTYFVGQQGLLVHDNEFRKPTRAIVPGLVQ